MADPRNGGGNAPLRRADWRFLLPMPPGGAFEHLVLLGGPDGLEERLVEVGLASQVRKTLPDRSSVDAVIVLDDAPADLDRIARCLAPGGVLYLEVDRKTRAGLLASPRRVARSLREAGLIPVGSYAALPDLGECKVYLPMQAPASLAWLVGALYPPSTFTRRVVGTALGRLRGRWTTAALRRVPCHVVVAAKPPLSSSDASVLADSALPAALRHARLHPLVLTDRGNRIVMLPFADDSEQPAAVLKVPKLPGFNGKTENEQAILREMRSQLDFRLRRALPEPLGILHNGDISVGLESYMPGRSLLSSSGRWGAPAGERIGDLQLAAAWLGEFHRRAEIGRAPWGERERSEWISGPFDAYRDSFGVTAAEEHLFERARAHAASLDGLPFPIVWLHRDYNVWNIFRNGRELAVIDWEGGRPGPALCDLLHFITHWYESVRHLRSERSKLRGFHDLFLRPRDGDLYAAAAHEALGRYMTLLRLDAGFLPLLLVYTWVELALRREDQQRLQGELRMDHREGNRNFPFIALLAAHGGTLFRTADLPDRELSAPLGAPRGGE